MGRASKDKRDIYYRKAKEEGFRARSAYKLLQLHEEFNILDPLEITTGAVDLCAAPGSWSQVLSTHFRAVEEDAERRHRSGGTAAIVERAGPRPRVIAVDLQEMAPISGVTLLQGDITSGAIAREVVRLLNASDSDPVDTQSASPSPQRKADIVVCDGAPDVTGLHELDEYLQHQLLLAALNITTFVLRPGGSFVTKMFRGPNTPFLIAKSEVFFRHVRVVKPKSSRNASMECFLLCQGFAMPEGYVPHFTSAAPASSSSATGAAASSLSDVGGGGLGGGSSYTPEAPRYVYGDAHTCTSSAVTAAVSSAEGVLLPFLSCGDLTGYDADMCYSRAEAAEVLGPVQPPLQAPYLRHDSRPQLCGEVEGDQSAMETAKRPRVE